MSRKVKWSAIGAIVGLIYGYFTMEPLSDRMLVVISNNIGFLIGSMIVVLPSDVCSEKAYPQ
mgnify:CR=1 FL=1